MFSDCSLIEGERLLLAEPLWSPFAVPFCFSAAAACLRVRTLGEPFILGTASALKAYSQIVVRISRGNGVSLAAMELVWDSLEMVIMRFNKSEWLGNSDHRVGSLNVETYSHPPASDLVRDAQKNIC